MRKKRGSNNPAEEGAAPEKKTFVLRISAEKMLEIERWAAEEFRSVNGQIEYLLSEAIRKRKRGS